MKAKKKLLIGTAIMALAAGGASAVSTFAWFTATASVDLASESSKTLTVAQQGLQETDLKVSFTIDADNNVELTNSGGDTYYINGDGIAVKKASNKAVGEYTVASVAWVQDAAYTAASADGTLASLAGKTYTVEMQGSTNVVLLANTTHSHTAAANKFKIKVATTSPYALSFVTTDMTGMTWDSDNNKMVGHFAIKATDTATTPTAPATTLTAEAAHTTDIISVKSIG